MKSKVTTKTLAEIRRLNGEGKHDYEIAGLLGLNASTARYWRICMGLPKVKRYNRRAKVKQYAVYDGKTDELVILGTAKECAEALDMEINSLRKAMTKAKHGAYKKYTFCEVEAE